jgi:predicted transcriptional regulator
MDTAIEPVKKRYPVDHGDYERSKIDVGKAFELRMKGMQVKDIAKLMGVTPGAVTLRLQAFSKVLKNPNNIKVYDDNIDKILSAAQLELVSSALSRDKIKKAATYQLVASYGILFDKQRLVRGQSTANVAYQDMTQAEAEIEERINKMRNGATIVLDSPPVCGIVE